MDKSNDARDDFWDLGKIVPKKKSRPTAFNTSTYVTNHEISGRSSDVNSGDKNRITLLDTLKPSAVSSEESYVPENSRLIKRVTVKNFADRYDFYGNFRKAAVVYYDYKTEKCDFAPFYSYMPQYSQLTSEQKQYYFYFRDMVRHGKYIKSDYSYLYLLVYEILNMPDYLPPNEGVILLCKLWREYRTSLPRIDSYFSVWIQDYCLVHRLACPMEYISEFIFDVIYASDFKEFYLSEMNIGADSATDAMIAYLSDYDWRKCRYRTSENKEMYYRHMIGAMTRVFATMFGADGMYENQGSPSKIERDAFPHSLCTHAVKCKLSIEYVQLSRELNARRDVTMCVRYCENKLRALIGIKSRLAIKDLSNVYKSVIDGYFDDILKREATKKRIENLPEYEKLYDAPSFEISFVGADEIERASWSTTARLISEDSEEYIGSISNTENVTKNENDTKAIVDCVEKSAPFLDTGAVTCQNNVNENEDNEEKSVGTLSKEDIDVLRTVLNFGLDENDMSLIDTVTRLNEYFSDMLGDIAIESDGEKFKIIDDYREDVEEWLLKQGK